VKVGYNGELWREHDKLCSEEVVCALCGRKHQKNRRHKCKRVKRNRTKAPTSTKHKTVAELSASGMTVPEFAHAKGMLPQTINRWNKAYFANAPAPKGRRGAARSSNSGNKAPELRKMTPEMVECLRTLVIRCRGLPPTWHKFFTEQVNEKECLWVTEPGQTVFVNKQKYTVIKRVEHSADRWLLEDSNGQTMPVSQRGFKRKDDSRLFLRKKDLADRLRLKFPKELEGVTFDALRMRVSRWCFDNGLSLRKPTTAVDPKRELETAQRCLGTLNEVERVMTENELPENSLGNLDETALRPFQLDLLTLHYKGAKEVPMDRETFSKFCMSIPVYWYMDGTFEWCVLWHNPRKKEMNWEEVNGTWFLQCPSSKMTRQEIYTDLLNFFLCRERDRHPPVREHTKKLFE
jgi:hypothetical protein